MLYTVEQVADQLNVSKATVYNKIKLNQFKDKIIIEKGQTMLSQDLIDLIQSETKVKPNTDQKTGILDEDLVKLNLKLVDSLMEQLKEARAEIKEKDIIIAEQLTESNLRVKEANELTRNGQVLQSQNIKYIELTEKVREESVKKGFMSKLFKK